MAQAANASSPALQVVCAWPVSGQYGPGSRVLYYVLVAACIFARKEQWLKGACLAATLLFPAVAAIHGIVLAAMHIPGAVDMDVFGAFQLCSIGILAAPVTVRLSRTYLKIQVEMPYSCGRSYCLLVSTLSTYHYIPSNTSLRPDCIGLLSLTIEFYRIPTTPCTHDDLGFPISTDPRDFPYLNATCGLTCDTNLGPFSTMRQGSGNNIYVIPAPDALTFNAATLLAAACCIPAVLLLIVMWMQILETIWKKSNSTGEGNESIRRAKRTTRALRLFRKFFEVPLWAAAVLAIMITGERNLFSPQVHYQTEPMASVGQWAPIVGIAFALFGALYLSLTEAMQAPTEEAGFKNRVARLFLRAGDHFGAVAREVFDDSEFRQGRATSEFPEVPGERNRNRELSRIRTTYSQNHRHEENGSFDLAREETFSTVADSRVGAEDDRPENRDQALRRRDTLEVPTASYNPGSSPVASARAPPDGTQSLPTPSIIISTNPDDADLGANVAHTLPHVT
ncbi:hypothetical protein LTS00_006416 [Friedmanniomyces endolithicus]|uniref:Uncharacterized protein n=1 Tax=Friedmanniomyces endolithicus TaxID=329885 RepID=A0AAN6FLA5_9PEZI|nr:hypothetical protein LTS00_006416 [Friedmanniomyces endolithicus]KAK0319804.1 hypothetical protein LTR82_009139 [Friedmanniomyces endolithicus]